MAEQNPLISDDQINFLLHHVLDLESLFSQSYFQDHSWETSSLYIDAAKKLARTELFEAYKPMDNEPPKLSGDSLKVHPKMHQIYQSLAELGVIAATRPVEVGGAQLPSLAAVAAHIYLMAGNLSAYAYMGLTTGAARLIESFGAEDLQRTYMDRMYSGEWTGTMALTESQAGSSLADVSTKATPTEDGHYLLEGTKIFISGGDQDFTNNIVHLALARIEGAPAGIRGVSLFVVPKKRPQGDSLVDNDCTTTGVFHKVGWKGLPSIALTFGEKGDCHGYLVGEANKGIRYMFQMMNEARLMVGLNGVATSSVAYYESLIYAQERPQGRKVTQKDPSSPQLAIIEHADVKRMLMRQKAIVEGGMHLVFYCAQLNDLFEHGDDAAEQKNAGLLLDLLTPVAKTFPAEYGFEANALAVQIHGGYGYTKEYLPEAFLRDQKLNTLHEGTTGIQSLDLLGRKLMAGQGAAAMLYVSKAQETIEKAGSTAGCENLAKLFQEGLQTLQNTAMQLGQLGMTGEIEQMLMHSADFLQAFSLQTISWMLLEQAVCARRANAEGKLSEDFAQSKLLLARYFLNTELPRAQQLFALCTQGEDSYVQMKNEWF